jgi:hypothetical protein
MVGTKASKEDRIRDEVSPTLANKGGAEKGGWLRRRKTEEDLPEDVILVYCPSIRYVQLYLSFR